ncbi:hypothetical protein Nepgr_006442 [Nepenthes gracilis]|uniref:Uncharacterized protein n=1 Tax=Nepenthes gracilis TaxID=150966 RepID=A0AAD3XHC3_NEPGR|nr:hypothetical protein Nepgr_006442 [Nepenthes gracilis]
MEEYPGDYFQSLKHRLKQIFCCCFTDLSRHNQGGSTSDHLKPRLLRSSSQWVKSRVDFPEFKDKCRNLVSRMSTRRRANSADFRYDQLNYALNFDKGDDDRDLDEFPLRNFSARLPPLMSGTTPAPDVVAQTGTTEITAFS